MYINFVLVELTFNCDLDLELTHGNMGFAHPLVEVNVSFKFEGKPSISEEVIELTRIGDGRTHRPTDRRDKANPV